MKKPSIKRASRRWPLTTVFAVAALLNYPWERAQSSLYAGMDGSSIAPWLCFTASLVDGLLVLRRQDWFAQPGIRGYVFMLAAGLAISVSVEWGTVHVAQWWAYTARMPLVPGLVVGIPPVAQMLVLPPMIFRVVTAWRGRG